MFPNYVGGWRANAKLRALVAGHNREVLAQSGVASAPVTGTVAQVTIATINIPALGPNDSILIYTS